MTRSAAATAPATIPTVLEETDGAVAAFATCGALPARALRRTAVDPCVPAGAAAARPCSAWGVVKPVPDPTPLPATVAACAAWMPVANTINASSDSPESRASLLSVVIFIAHLRTHALQSRQPSVLISRRASPPAFSPLASYDPKRHS
jgi:hypothetical protein